MAAVVTAVLLAGCGEAQEREVGRGEPSPSSSTEAPKPQIDGGDSDPSPAGEAAGDWEQIAKARQAFHAPESLFWIDGRLVVVAGSTIEAWDPERDRWEVLVEIPQAEECEGCGYAEIAVWSGEEILLWGGGFSYKYGDLESAGAAFDPRSKELRPLATAPIPSRWYHTAVWTGGEMIVWGGSGCEEQTGQDECRDGAAYDPITDSWRRIADAPMGGYAHTLVWTGRKLIVWGGTDDGESEGTRGYPRNFLNIGAAYDPDTDSWRELEASPLDPRGWHSSVWTGDEMIVWGGDTSPCTTGSCESESADAAAYDPSTGKWRPIAHGPLSGRVDHSAVWTGEQMIVWGGSPPGGGIGYDDGAMYDPQRDSWALLPGSPLSDRYRHGALWNGKAMFIWGGITEDESGLHMGQGAVFTPEL